MHEASAARTPGAQAYRCLIFDSEGIVRRLWAFPEHWDRLTDDEILRLLDAPPTPAHGVRTVLHSGSHPTVIASIAAYVHAQELVAELMVVRDTNRERSSRNAASCSRAAGRVARSCAPPWSSTSERSSAAACRPSGPSRCSSRRSRPASVDSARARLPGNEDLIGAGVLWGIEAYYAA